MERKKEKENNNYPEIGRIMDEICKKYNIDIKKEIEEIIEKDKKKFTNCKHNFIKYNNKTYCSKCDLINDCSECYKNENNYDKISEYELNNYDFIEIRCEECKYNVERLYCKRCRKQFSYCYC